MEAAGLVSVLDFILPVSCSSYSNRNVVIPIGCNPPLSLTLDRVRRLEQSETEQSDTKNQINI